MTTDELQHIEKNREIVLAIESLLILPILFWVTLITWNNLVLWAVLLAWFLLCGVTAIAMNSIKDRIFDARMSHTQTVITLTMTQSDAPSFSEEATALVAV